LGEWDYTLIYSIKSEVQYEVILSLIYGHKVGTKNFRTDIKKADTFKYLLFLNNIGSGGKI